MVCIYVRGSGKTASYRYNVRIIHMKALYENIYFQLYVIYWIVSSILIVFIYNYKQVLYKYFVGSIHKTCVCLCL